MYNILRSIVIDIFDHSHYPRLSINKLRTLYRTSFQWFVCLPSAEADVRGIYPAGRCRPEAVVNMYKWLELCDIPGGWIRMFFQRGLVLRDEL